MLSIRMLLFVLLVNSISAVSVAQQAVEDPQLKNQSTEQTQADDTEDADDNENPNRQADSDTSEEPKPRKKTRSRKWTNTKRSEEFISIFAPVVASTSNAVVKINDDDRQVALGTVVDSDGFILTKASELKGELSCEFSDGRILKPSIVGVDPKTDLVLLKVDATGLTAAEIDNDLSPSIGSWLATVSQQELPLSVGIVSHGARQIRNVAINSAIIGIQPANRSDGDGVRINRVSNDSPAERAGLLVNDVITKLDDDVILNNEQLLEKLSHFHPGDKIVLIVIRGEEELEIPVKLGKQTINPMRDRSVQQNQLGSKLSNRRSNFPLALQHDSTLDANECGGPVVDLSGRVVGINIARDGRVSSLALPNEIVGPVIAKLKSGKFTPSIVNRKEIKRVEKTITQLEKDFELLPQEKMRLELKYSGGAALETELRRQVEETKKRLKELQARYFEQKKENRSVNESITGVQKKQSNIERDKGPLEQELKFLKTGVR